MACAWMRMCKNTNGQHVSSHEFEKAKRIRNNTPVPLETRIKISKARKGKSTKWKGGHHTTEARKNMSLAHIGQNPWNKGKKTRPLTEHEKEIQRRIQKELVYWTNGVENKRCKESPGEGWHKGFTVKDRTKFATNVGKHWFTNGLNDVCVFECPGHEWRLGRVNSKIDEDKLEGLKKFRKEFVKDRVWWVKGDDRKFQKECPGEGWSRGTPYTPTIETRSKQSKALSAYLATPDGKLARSRTSTGMLWWNKNGVNKRAKECPGFGWIRGKFKKIINKNT